MISIAELVGRHAITDRLNSRSITFAFLTSDLLNEVFKCITDIPTAISSLRFDSHCYALYSGVFSNRCSRRRRASVHRYSAHSGQDTLKEDCGILVIVLRCQGNQSSIHKADTWSILSLSVLFVGSCSSLRIFLVCFVPPLLLLLFHLLPPSSTFFHLLPPSSKELYVDR